MNANEPLLAAPRIAILVPLGGLAIIALGVLVDTRIAVLLLGLFAIAGAVARAVGPDDGAFAVRSRALDVAILGVFGIVLPLLGLATLHG